MDLKKWHSDITTTIQRELHSRIRKWQKEIGYDKLNALVGIVVLLIGSIAFAGMIYYAFERQFSEEAFLKRTSRTRADVAMIEGNWITSVGNGRAVLQANDGVYQIIFTKGGSNIRRYSRGTVEAQGEHLIFRPQASFGKPENDDNFRYYGWPMTTFAIQAARRDRKLVWQKGPLMFSLPEQMLETIEPEKIEEMAKKFNLENPLFKLAEEEDFIIWKSLQ